MQHTRSIYKKLTEFLCDNNKQLEIKIMKTIPFVKYNILRINLTKDVKDLYMEKIQNTDKRN